MDYTDFTLIGCLIVAVCFGIGESRKGLNGRCRTVDECKPIGYFCGRNETCQCRSGYRPDEKWTKCTGYVGSKCIYDHHCIEGAYCAGIDGRATCKCQEDEDYFLSDDGQTCISGAVSTHHQRVLYPITLGYLLLRFYLNT